jgi:eukaryotic-like serine/threonine-protein kinase
MADLTAALAGRYQLERELGHGGMATVFLARDLKHHRAVALKVLRPELAAWLGRDRFLREVRVTAGFDHPHILPVLDSGGGDQGDILWYTMPFVQGETLRERLRRESRLPLGEVVRLTSQIADALSYAHRHGVVHRDIKPENILLSEGHARVADFGIARAAEVAETGERLTATGLVVGTPTYMSPEQAGGGEVDARSDVYALACVTYEMLAGEPPYSGPSAQAIITKRYREPYPSLDRSRPGLPRAVDPILQQALAIEPADRFQSAREYASALVEAASGRGPSIARAALQSRRTRAALLLIVALAFVGLSLWAVRLVRHRPGSPRVSPAGAVRIAVLPFMNVGDSSRAYVTDGLVDAVRGRLAAVPSLEVIASSSTEEYRRSSKSVKVIGSELGVPYVLVGKVRWISGRASGERMQVAPELVEIASGATRWQDAVQASMAEAPTLPATIAVGIVQALGVKVTPSARNALSDSVTTSPEAYDLYLRATDYAHRITLYQAPISLLKPAIELFRRAIAIDTSFARAKVGLANALRASANYGGGDTIGYREADSLITAVLERDPTMVEAIAARGMLREDRDDLDAALRLYQEAAALQPSNATVQARITFVQALRQDSAALVTGARAVALAPRDPDMLRRVIQGTSIFRNYDQLERYSDRLISLEAGEPNGYFHKALAQLGARADTAAALATLRRSESVIGGISELIAWGYAMCGPSGWQRWHTLRVGELMSAQGRDTLDYYWNQGQIAAAEKRFTAERAYADTLLRLLLRVKRTDPFYPLALIQRGWARAVLGDSTQAHRDLAVADEVTREKPAFGAFFQYQVASAYAALGDTAAAVLASRRLLEHPSAYNRRMLRLAPEFARLWAVPEFQQLLADTRLP